MDPDTRKTKFGAGQSGQGFVEFALILPVLLTWGIVEFGRLLLIYTEVSNAAREAVRYGVARGADPYAPANYLDCEGIINAGKATTVLTPLEEPNFAITYDRGGGETLGSCFDDDRPAVQLGDRLLITVTYEVAPLILFQDAGPFQVQFSTARTIVYQGIPMDDGGAAGPTPGGQTALEITYGETNCEAYLTWFYDGEDAEAFNLYRTRPFPPVLIAEHIEGSVYPTDGSFMSVQNEERYMIRPWNEAGEGTSSNEVVIEGCSGLIVPPNFAFTRTGYFPSCHGYFTWGPVYGIAGYHLYVDGSPIGGDITGTRYPPEELGDTDVAEGQVYELKAFDDGGAEGPAATLTIEGCTPPPLTPPTGFTFVLNQAFLPCNGHFTWDGVEAADKYRMYESGSQFAEVTAPTTRFPAATGTYYNVLNGQRYNVTAWNPLEESGFSGDVFISGCQEGGGEPHEVTFYLHSNPTPPAWHGNAPPPLTMNPTGPTHDNLYNYHTTDPGKPGREVTKGGGTPPGEGNPEKYLEWRGGPYAQPLLVSDVSLTIYGKNPLNQDVTAHYYLYLRSSGGGYTWLSEASYVWLKQGVNWKPATISFGAGPFTVLPGEQLVLWVTSDGLKNVQFAYDTETYQSVLQFTGEW
jgi:hypothetical protein